MTELTPSPVPTQVKQPWRATLRTAFAVLLALSSMAPLIYSAATNDNADQATGWAAGALGIAAAVTRVLALPAVEAFLQTYVPFLAADSKS
jgi:uncharacterized membrane protein HdeD (DUF308 family)